MKYRKSEWEHAKKRGWRAEATPETLLKRLLSLGWDKASAMEYVSKQFPPSNG